jgi:hypothetical protein
MTSPKETLQNLAKIGKLKAEPSDQAEFDGLVRLAGKLIAVAKELQAAVEALGPVDA